MNNQETKQQAYVRIERDIVLANKTIDLVRHIYEMERELSELKKDNDDLRKRCKYNLDPGAQITCWDEYERLRAENDKRKIERSV